MQHWYAVQAKPHRERQAAIQFIQRDLQVYLPLIRVKPVNPRSAKERPFFPGYLFARADAAAIGPAQYQWVPGIRSIVHFGGQPAVVPDQFIHDLQQRLKALRTAGGLGAVEFRHGDPVRITHGPLAGYEAIFDLHLKDSERVRVLLEVLRRFVPVQISPAHIRRLSPAG